jgi:hypothetical protein
VLAVGGEERLADEGLGDLGVDARGVDLLEDRAGRLALAEAAQGDPLAELAVGGAETIGDGLPRDLDDELLLDRGDVFDADLHGAAWLPQEEAPEYRRRQTHLHGMRRRARGSR